jgi:CubicO group peptidase (beta-lactamase class C family)
VDAASLVDAIDARAPAALERYGVPGMAVGALSRGERLERGYGVASLATGEAVWPETRFRIASITKPLVATLAMRLVEEGRLALDEPLTGLRLPWAGITLRHLLSHQAGLAGDWPVSLADYGEGDDAFKRLAGDEAAAGPVGPGELFSYCNPGYWVAGAVIERAAGMPFEEAMRRFVTEPLGMERTGFTPEGPVAVRHLAEPGSREHRVAEPLPYPRARRPSGGLYSCTGDLLDFAAHLLGGPGLLSADSLRELETAQIEVSDDGGYGLGLGVSAARGRPTLEHGGSVPGFRSQLLLVPDERTALVLLTNSGRGLLAIEEMLDAVGLALRLPPEVVLPAAQLDALAGTYREALGSEIGVSVRSGGLDLAWVETDQFTGERVEHPPVHLRPARADRFVVRDGDDRGDSAEFFRGGRLLRYAWLFERVPG